MEQPGLDDRHRDKNGEISRKHGNTQMKALRRIYGVNTIPMDLGEDTKLSVVLERFNFQSLRQMLSHHKKMMELLHMEHSTGGLAHRINMDMAQHPLDHV